MRRRVQKYDMSLFRGDKYRAKELAFSREPYDSALVRMIEEGK